MFCQVEQAQQVEEAKIEQQQEEDIKEAIAEPRDEKQDKAIAGMSPPDTRPCS